jgi:hypothetical protein
MIRLLTVGAWSVILSTLGHFLYKFYSWVKKNKMQDAVLRVVRVYTHTFLFIASINFIVVPRLPSLHDIWIFLVFGAGVSGFILLLTHENM